MKYQKYSEQIKPLDLTIEKEIQNKLDNLTKPIGSLGRLEEVARLYCLIRKTLKPVLKNKVIWTLAADHGVVEEGVSAYPQEVTSQMVMNFLSGGAGINVLARYAGAKVIVADFGVKGELRDKNLKNKKVKAGTQNMAKGPAMSREEAVQSIEHGIDMVEEEIKNNIDIIGIGEMGIGNTTSASAITSVITGKKVKNVTARGTGINDKTLKNKIRIIKKAININKPDCNDGIDILSKLGGFEIGGMAGVILAGAVHNIPIMLDGFISGAAALIAYKLNPAVKDYLIASIFPKKKGTGSSWIIWDWLPCLTWASALVREQVQHLV